MIQQRFFSSEIFQNFLIGKLRTRLIENILDRRIRMNETGSVLKFVRFGILCQEIVNLNHANNFGEFIQ